MSTQGHLVHAAIPVLSRLIFAAFPAACRPATSASQSGSGVLPPCTSKTTRALSVRQALAIQEDLPIAVEGYLVKMNDLCLVCEDGPNLWRPATQSVRLAERNESQPHPSLGLYSKRKSYHCPHRSEATCSDIGVGEHVRIRGHLVHSAAEHEGPYLTEPEICRLTGATR